MKSYVNVGIIGVGGNARLAHVNALKNVKEANIVAICDINEEILNIVGDELGIPQEKRYINYEDLICDTDVEAVEVCTPNYLHVPMAVAALKAGKHVNVEKPVSTDYASTAPLQEVLSEIDPEKQVAMTCFSYRFSSAVRYAKWILDKGMLGDIVNVKVEYLKDSAFMKGRKLEWRFIKELGGTGVLGDLGAHLVDMTRLLVGEFTSVAAHTEIIVKERMKMDGSGMGKVETDDFCSFIARMDNGAVADFTISRCAIGEHNTIRYDIYGTKGLLSFDLNHWDSLKVCVGEIDVNAKGMHTVTAPAEFKALQEQTFIDAILGKKNEHFPSLYDAIECQKILSAIQEADEKKIWVAI
ncbi:MAG: Gfo/Idh/MocA family oxidoreductase [Lachnospiraceae bacterium]|nr:Gfo/Idh/MocA family oxidoreductase [Lachnospiraceae bacterium]